MSLTKEVFFFILNACSPSFCVAYGNESAEYKDAPPGTYYIVVDGFTGASGAYTLEVSYPGAYPGVQFFQTIYGVAEGAGSAQVTVVLASAPAEPVRVDYVSNHGTARAASDYTAVRGRLTFAPDQTSQAFSVAILENALKEADETVVLTLSNPANGILGTPSQATLTILNTSMTNGSGM